MLRQRPVFSVTYQQLSISVHGSVYLLNLNVLDGWSHLTCWPIWNISGFHSGEGQLIRLDGARHYEPLDKSFHWEADTDDDDVGLHVLVCRVDILGTNCDQGVSMVQRCFTSTETIKLIRTGSPGRPPRLSHSSWTLSVGWYELVCDMFSMLPYGTSVGGSAAL